MDGIGEALLEIERSLWTGGSETYRQNLDKTCLTVFPGMAGVQPREEIAAMADARRWRDVSIEMKGMIEPEPGMAILCYESRAKRAGGEPYAALVSSGYVARGDGWKLVFHQQTELREEAGGRKPPGPTDT